MNKNIKARIHIVPGMALTKARLPNYLQWHSYVPPPRLPPDPNPEPQPKPIPEPVPIPDPDPTRKPKPTPVPPWPDPIPPPIADDVIYGARH